MIPAQTLPVRVPGTVAFQGWPGAPPEVELTVAFPALTFERPLYLVAPPDGTDRLFVLEQAGRVRVFDNRPDVESAAVALDLSDKVIRCHNEEGLLGLAFHPRFARNRQVFLYYSTSPQKSVVSRFLMDPQRARILRETEKVLLEVPQPYPNHNGGMIDFGPDGFLYISLGDGGSGGDPQRNGQNKASLLGKILRLDVDRPAGKRPYGIPRDNPFVKEPGARPEIFAYGLRNVWRFSFERATGRLFGGDVGQIAWEEVVIIRKGGNYGWNRMEGTHLFAGGEGEGPFAPPLIEYSHAMGRSITGGYVYRGKRAPSLRGSYVYGDFFSGALWAARLDGDRAAPSRSLGFAHQPSSFGEDRHGELYLMSFDGKIHAFTPRSDASPGRFPTRLSETGLFPGGRPHPALLAYDVTVPLWSDGADKTRFVMLPGLEKIQTLATGALEFPVGTIFVKTFSFGARKLETRLFMRRAPGWEGYTYVWDEAQTDAVLIDDRLERQIEGRAWTFPSRADCLSCHGTRAGSVLGFRPEQLGGQLETFWRMGYFETKPAATPYRRNDVRAYLAVNCGNCHHPQGSGNARIDLRADTPLESTGLLDTVPTHGDMGVPDARLLKPGRPEESLLILRMRDVSPKGMPPLSHNLPDREALARLEAWVRSLRP